MINRVVLVGRITKDPELRKTQSGLSTVSFTLAVNRRVSKDQEQQADFINCVAWRQTADYMANYVKKGTLLGVEGRIQTRNYDDKSGHKVYVTEIVCDSVQTLVRSNSESQSAYQASAPANNSGYAQGSQSSYDDFGGETLNIQEDDLPF
ncbi:single-stranded DNA-binding protein [Dielma fastidiosa]|uniref:Single-stranded DNA-binding protein n=1 Tax=Dielma fastidiosa TaxID=1034346 RepID=A0A318L177_9FIRM|nr:single-stranded DNA-binding protein [Dielma fastidiosa]PXX73402.1 single-strand DNA-binding protein [Dielma fastidiosa]